MWPVQRRVWEILEEGQPGDVVSHVFDVALLTLIVVNVAAVIIGTVPAVAARWGTELRLIEAISVAVFTVEYVLRLWSAAADVRYAGAARGRLRFMRTPLAIVDLLAFAPAYLTFLGVDLRVTRALRLLRILRIAKLARYLNALRLFARVASAKREELVMTSAVVAILLLLASSLMYFAENEAQPDRFSSIPAAMWWGIVTLTTVGYGDVYPVTTVGRLIGAVVAVLGIGLFALPTAILGSGFVEEIQRQRQVQPMTCPHCGRELPPEIHP